MEPREYDVVLVSEAEGGYRDVKPGLLLIKTAGMSRDEPREPL